MIAYIALLIQFINLVLRLFHGKQNRGRIVGGFLSEAWDKIRCTIHALVPVVVAIWKALLALYAGIFIHSSLKLIGNKVYFLYYRIMEIDDLTTLLWDRACDAVVATLAVALIVWTMYHAIYVPLRFVFPWLLLLKRKLFGRGRIRWRPDRMMLRDVYRGDAPPVPTGVAARRVLRTPRYTRVIPLLDGQRLTAALLEFEGKQNQYIRECQSHPPYDHWRGWVRTQAAIEPANAMDNNPTAVEEVVPGAEDALNEPAVAIDDAPIDVEVGVPVADVEEPAVVDPTDDPAIAAHDEEVVLGTVADEPDDTFDVQDVAPAVAVDDATVDAEVGVPIADVEEPAVDDPAIAAHDDEGVVLGVVAEEPDDTFDVQDMAADNNPVAEEDVVPDAVLVRNKEKQAHTVPLRRSPRLRQAAGSVFLSSNTGRVVRRSARIMSRR